MTLRIINDHYVLPTDAPGKLQALFPQAKVANVKGQDYCAVPFSLEAARILNNIGIRAPSPILSQYDWPGRYRPRWYQKETAEFFTLNMRCYCLSEMRTGKTLSSLWAADYLRQAGKIKRTLIVAPLSTIYDVWEQNIFESFPLRTFTVLYGSRQKRLDLLARPADFYIINHHGMKLIEDALSKRPDIDLVIVDELAELRSAKNKKGVLWAPMNRVLNKQGIVRAAWGLTGTPTPNEPTDAFGQCKLITPENYSGHFTSFKNETMLQFGPFKWVPKKNCAETVARVLKPSIRFERTVCSTMEPCFIDRRAQLSEEQDKAYKQMIRQAATELRGQTVTAVNAAVLLSKLIQISCLSEDTEVLCEKGWTPIQNVRPNERVWDGVEWVTHGGVIFKGIQSVLNCGGILSTTDHLFLTTEGWKQAKEIVNGDAGKRFGWPDVRFPDRFEQGGLDYWEDKVRAVVVSMRLRKGGYSEESEFAEQISPECSSLWMSAFGDKQDTRNDSYQAVQHMVPNAVPMSCQIIKRLQTVWGQGHRRMRSVEELLRSVLGGYARRVRGALVIRASRQQWAVLQRKLHLGNRRTAVKQSQVKCLHKYSTRYDVSSPGREVVRAEQRDYIGEDEARLGRGRTASTFRSARVYDIVNCGLRNRFVVRGANGELRIVHNCGVAYGADGSLVKFDYGPRLKVLQELIEENNEKVLVFVPFTGALDTLATELRKRWSVAIVDGGVSPGKRAQIFRDFRTLPNPWIILANPDTMAHGLDLTAASLSIWYAPYLKAAKVQQANARTDGSKQTAKIDIAHIYATAEEKRAYAVLREKGRLQDVVLALTNGGK